MPLKIIRLALLALLLSHSSLSACEFIMGYRTSDRLPLINKSPDNQGLYFSLYQLALDNIGCTLKVVRAPKKRILRMLEQGEIDFYPGMGYSKQREYYLHFFQNGLSSHSVAVSHINQKDIANIEDMRGKVLLRAFGSKDFDSEKNGILVRYAHDLSVNNAIKLLSQQRADYFLYNKDSINYYLKNNPNKNIKIHPCCYEPHPMRLGFAKNSKHAQATKNLNYKSSLSGSIDNLKESLTKQSKAYLFKQELQKLKNSKALAQLKASFYQ